MQRTAPDRRTDGKALTPCIALVDKGGKGFPFKHIVRSVLVDAIPHHSSEAITMNALIKHEHLSDVLLNLYDLRNALSPEVKATPKDPDTDYTLGDLLDDVIETLENHEAQ